MTRLARMIVLVVLLTPGNSPADDGSAGPAARFPFALADLEDMVDASPQEEGVLDLQCRPGSPGCLGEDRKQPLHRWGHFWLQTPC